MLQPRNGGSGSATGLKTIGLNAAAAVGSGGSIRYRCAGGSLYNDSLLPSVPDPHLKSPPGSGSGSRR